MEYQMLVEQFLWVEKYRPSKIEDTILPDELKKTFQQFVDQKNIPNLILSGSAGVGKTTVARAMLEELGCDYIVINGSLNGDIDTLRYEIQGFASSVSFTGGRKYVILDEADYLTSKTQPALRNFMEEYAKNCGFILTCNYKNKIIEPLHSRCSVIDFKIGKKDVPKLATQFFKRVIKILDDESVKYDKASVAEVVQLYYPDSRKILNELQRYAATGEINSGILASVKGVDFSELADLMKKKNFTEMRKWVGMNVDFSAHDLFRKFYDEAYKLVTPESVPPLVVLIGKYQYQASFVADHEINFMAFLVEMLVECDML
jgi:DNA polymerase III delta prime subunit